MYKKIGLFPFLFNSLLTQNIEAIRWSIARCDELRIVILSDKAAIENNIATLGNVDERKRMLTALFPEVSILISDSIKFQDVISTSEKGTQVFHGSKYAEILPKKYKQEFIKCISENGLIYTEFQSDRISEIHGNELIKYQNTIVQALGNSIPIVGVDVYDHISAHCVRNAFVKANLPIQMAFWGGSLCYSASRLRSDSEFFSVAQRLDAYNQIREIVQDYPIIVDADTGGSLNNLTQAVRLAAFQNVEAIVLEDKVGEKINSLVENSKKHELAPIETFINKLLCVKNVSNEAILPIARLEGLVVDWTPQEVGERVIQIYKSGATNVFMIHTKESTIDNVVAAMKIAKEGAKDAKFMMVPQNITNIGTSEYIELGFSIVIYPNQILRAVIKTIESTARLITSGVAVSEYSEKLESISRLINIESEC